MQPLPFDQFLARMPLVRELPADLRAEVAALVRTLRVDRRTVLFREGNPFAQVFFLVRGRVKATTITPDGREVIFGLLRAGDVFPLKNLLDRTPYPGNAVALEPCELGVLSLAEFESLLHRDGVAQEMLRHLVDRISGLHGQIRWLNIRTVHGRLADYLLHTSPNGVELSHRELAGLLGVSREALTRTISDLERLRVVSQTPQGLRVLDPGVLHSIWLEPTLPGRPGTP